MFFFSCEKEEQETTTGNTQELPAAAVHALQTEADIDVLLNEIGDDRVVLLGEATHGTSEFYTWRAAISRRLIEEKGFSIIAVEGDWTDAYTLNNHISSNSNAATAEEALLQGFDRWPTWMWANEEIADLAEWLQAYNAGRAAEAQVGFYGLDVYGMWESLDEVTEYLENTDPAAAQTAREAISCFAPYNQNENAYSSATRASSENCADELAALLEAVQNRVAAASPRDEAAFNALQNAMVAVNAERYYRAAAVSSAQSWNIRDEHMMGTIDRLLEQHGPDAKIIVWEHNTHVGDARATTMADNGMVNVGQLTREEYGEEEVYIVGFGTYSGTVMAAQSWGSATQVMNVPEAQSGSWEWMLHRHGPSDKIILLDELRRQQLFMQRIGHRAIGVTYNPGDETGNYVPSVLPERYNAFIFIDQTEALHPLQ
ncbi:erythromycin esterase family protein [Pontibacter diazotrophicus]|uniref:Erythromycin esterase family protein n=2 Tax=Pontibacter diazotrophicus TaxID=1400979 RepID=A0A3D8LBW5_9BACT|nr:erythromycin esterase family protein [Pontibacter diazotrophicus]